MAVNYTPIPTGAAAVAALWNTRLQQLDDAIEALATRRWFNVKAPAYGALGDGVTDDRLAIQAAIDACEAVGGGVVYFPYSTYIVSTAGVGFPALTVGDNVHVLGDGMGASIIKLKSGTANGSLIFQNAGYPATRNYRILFEHLTLDGNLANQDPANHHTGISLRDILECRAAFVEIKNVQGLAVAGQEAFGIGINGGGDTSVDNLVTILGCVLRDCNGLGIGVQNGRGVMIQGNTVRGMLTMGISISTTVAGELARVGIVGNVVEDCDNGINLETSYDCTVVGNTARLCATTGISLSAAERTLVQGNISKDNDDYGIRLHNSHDCRVIGNVATDTQATKTQDYGIYETGNSNRNHYSGNYVEGNIRLGLHKSGRMSRVDDSWQPTLLEAWTGANGAAWPAQWQDIAIGAPTIDIQTNKGRALFPTAATDEVCRRNTDKNSLNWEAWVDVTFEANCWVGMQTRRVDAANRGFEVRYNKAAGAAGELQIGKHVGGVFSTISTLALNLTVGTTYRLRVKFMSNRVSKSTSIFVKIWDPTGTEVDYISTTQGLILYGDTTAAFQDIKDFISLRGGTGVNGQAVTFDNFQAMALEDAG